MRVIARRELPHPGGPLTPCQIHDGYRYQAFTTNTVRGQAALLETRHRAHARVEDRIVNYSSGKVKSSEIHRTCSCFAADGTRASAVNHSWSASQQTIVNWDLRGLPRSYIEGYLSESLCRHRTTSSGDLGVGLACRVTAGES